MQELTRSTAEVLQKISDLYHKQGDDYRARMYSRAAIKLLKSDGLDPETEADDLTDIRGIGEKISEDILEYINTGEVTRLQELEN